MTKYSVTIQVAVEDVEADSPDEAIAWVKEEITSVLDLGSGNAGLRFYSPIAETYD